MFTDRIDAGRQLAAVLDDHDVEADIVLAVPRGGLPVGRVVADALGVPLDVVAARKIGAPHDPELALGAVASDGTVWLNDALIETLRIRTSYVDEQIETQEAAARKRVERYRGDRSEPDLHGKTVLVVDDGVATAATVIACLRQVRAAGAERVILAVPVAPPDAAEHLHAEADEVICVETPPHFRTVGQFYDDFEELSDDRASAYLTGEG